MAEIEHQAEFAGHLYAGVATLKSNPAYKTQRKKKGTPHGDPESYLDKIAAQLGIATNTLKSWIGQMGLKYVPGRVEDGKLFGLLWIVLKNGDLPADWLVRVLGATSIPVLEAPTSDWVKACLRKAKVLLDNGTFGAPAETDINLVVDRIFSQPDDQKATAPPPAPDAECFSSRHNLPMRWSNLFIGRRTILDILNRWLHSDTPLCLITGWGGMGKSTIALEAAYACLGDVRGEAANVDSPWPRVACAIWISADFKGMSYSHFLDTIAYQLGQAELIGMPDNGKQFVVRNALARHAADGTILLIVDNLDASDRDILAFLANLPQGTKAIMTSRDPLQKLFGDVSRNVFTVQVDGMDKQDALQYLRQEIRNQIMASTTERKKEHLQRLSEKDDEHLLPLAEAANGNPKALSLGIAYIADGMIPPETFIRDVQTAGRSLTALFDYLFGHTWERCHEDVRKLWMALSLFQTSPDEESWASAAGLSPGEFHRAVDQMRAWSLIDTERSDSELLYRAHQTVVLYGDQKMRENPVFRAEAHVRLADYYLLFLESRLGRQQIGHIYWKCLPGNDYTPVKRAWPNLFNLLKWCEESGNDEYLTAFMLRLSHFLSRISLPLRIELGLKAADAAGRLGRKLQEALFRIDTVGWANFEIGRMEDGLRQLELGLAIAAQVPDTPENRSERNDMRSLGLQFKARYLIEHKEFDQAKTLLEEVMAIPASPVIAQRALLLKGTLEMLENDHEQAVRSLEEAHRVSLTYGGEKSIEGHYLLGVACVNCGQYEKAAEAFRAFLPDASRANQIELIYFEYGMAQLAAAQNRVAEAIRLLDSVMDRIRSWEPAIRIRPEAEALRDRLQAMLQG